MNRNILKKSSFRCRRKTREKPVGASVDWKPNGHTSPGPGIEPGLSAPQHGGTTALTVFPNCKLLLIRMMRVKPQNLLSRFFFVCLIKYTKRDFEIKYQINFDNPFCILFISIYSNVSYNLFNLHQEIYTHLWKSISGYNNTMYILSLSE